MPTRFFNPRRRREHAVGFSLIELMIAMAVTIIVMVGAVMMFLKSTETNNMTMQMAEMQTNARVAANTLAQDISQAGQGLTGGIGLPGGPGTLPETFGVDPAYMTPQSFFSTPAPVTTTMYGVTPAYLSGPTIGGQQMDGINIVYYDPILSDTVKSNWSVKAVNLTSVGGTTTVDATGLNPPIIDPNTGLRVGDVLMFTGNGKTVVAAVTAAPAGNAFTIAPGDPLNINQAAATTNDLLSLGTTAGGLTTYPVDTITMMRLYVVTYFLQAVQPDGFTPVALPAAGATDYRLMRQLNGQPPVPVAEHIDYLHFFYDLSDPAAPPTTNLSHIPDAIEPAIGPNPATPAYSLIRTVYINVAARTAKPDGHGQYAHATINTAIGPQSLSFRNLYPPPSGP